MTPEEARLAITLALAAPFCLLLAALAALLARGQRGQRWQTAAVLAALVCAVADLLLVYLRWAGRLPPDFPLFTWSPLGLYGVFVALRLQPDGLLLMLPTIALAALGTWQARTASAAGRVAQALALIAAAGALLAGIAGDLVSLYLAIAIYLAAGVGVLWRVAGVQAAAHRAIALCAAGVGLLVCVLVLGEVNGLFQLAQLSTAGFTTGPFAGVVLAALVAAPAPPFHGWLLRVARHPMAPALGVAGAAICLVLLLTAFQVTAGQFTIGWERSLGALGWLCALVATGIALVRRAPPVRLAALFVGRASVLLLGASVATPAAMAGAVLYFLLAMPFAALLWVLVRITPAPDAGTPSSLPGTRAADRLAPMRRPGFWLFALVLACAAGLPGTIGGAARNTLVGALTSWPSGDQLHRIPPLIVDAATLVVGGGLLWQRPWFARLGGWGSQGRWDAWGGWAVVALSTLVLCAPAFFPGQLIGSWFDPAAARAAATSSSPLALAASPIPTLFSGLLGLLSLWALVQRLRGREWLPAPGRAVIGIIALGWGELRRGWRRRGLGSIPADATGSGQRHIEAFAGRVLALLRPLEERYYAAGAVMLAVALIYIIGR